VVVKLIDIIFPIAPLPKDKKERNTVIEGYERSINKPTNVSAKGLLFTFVLFLVGIFSVSNGFSTFDTNIYICILLPALLYFTSLILFLFFNLKRSTTSIHAKHTISLFWSFVFSISFINAVLGLIHHDSLHSSKYINVGTKMYLLIFCISILVYYIGYWYFFKRFNKRMVQQAQNNSTIIGIGASGGLIGVMIARTLSYTFFVLLMFIGVLFIASFSASALVNYRQYDNIQCAKKGMTFK